jgi:hypothetical protein
VENPRKRTTIATEAVGDGLGVFDQQQQQAYVLNATSALVWQRCDGQTTPQQLTELLRQQFNMSRAQAEQVTWLALDELGKANLLEAPVASPQPLSAALTRRQMLMGAATAGLALALVPLVAPVTVQAAAGHTLIPLLDCVVDNGDGTLTARFGYLNNSTGDIIVPIGPKNMVVPAPSNQLPPDNQPSLFEPGTHDNVFEVVFNEADTVNWVLQADGDRRHQVEASADSERCPAPTTTTPAPTTTTPAPTTTAPPEGTTSTNTTTTPPDATTTTTTTTVAP